jgi:uncharacterized protein YbaA (DUF1428 family)
MPRYTDGFVIPVPKKKVEAYRKIAVQACKVWMEHGALDYNECVLEDNVKFGVPFLKLTKAKSGETVIFAWITYKSRAHRDRVNKKVMTDPRMNAMCDPKDMPFAPKRMTMGGFEIIVSPRG